MYPLPCLDGGPAVRNTRAERPINVSRSTSTRLIHLDLGQSRNPARNIGTLVGCNLDQVVDVPFEALFFAHYRSIRALAKLGRPGVGVLAVDLRSCESVARGWVARRPDRANTLIVGRHSACDIVLEDGSISLRHLAVLVPRIGYWDMEYSLRELHTGRGMHTELHQPFGSAVVDHFGAFRLGPYALFTFATGEPKAWPELASEAWTYVRGATANVPSRRAEWTRASDGHDPIAPMRPTSRAAAPTQKRRLCSSVTVLPSPITASERLLAPGEPPAVRYRLTTEHGSTLLSVGMTANVQGILIGRYTRCDSVLTDDRISRIHVLLLGLSGDLIAVDTASENGLFVQGQEESARVVSLSRGEKAVLGEGLAVLEWVEELGGVGV